MRAAIVSSAAGSSWTGWDMIQKLHRADQALRDHGRYTDSRRVSRGG
jgi:hypothetical protein